MSQKENPTIEDSFSLWRSVDGSQSHWHKYVNLSQCRIRESCLNASPNSESGRYQHKIVTCEKAQVPVLPRGGILADDMGLGKTLTMLSAIVSSLVDASRFVASPEGLSFNTNNRMRWKAKSTLVIAPSAGE
jgi:SNF2 family DNA or RNA helicase